MVESVRGRGAEKLHRVLITGVFGSEAATERLQGLMVSAMRPGEG